MNIFSWNNKCDIILSENTIKWIPFIHTHMHMWSKFNKEME